MTSSGLFVVTNRPQTCKQRLVAVHLVELVKFDEVAIRIVPDKDLCPCSVLIDDRLICFRFRQGGLRPSEKSHHTGPRSSIQRSV